jgi:outer membrane protein assembly factor BamB
MKWSLPMLLICLLYSSIIAEDADEWPMFQHDPQHTGFSPSKMPQSLKEVWTKERPTVSSGLLADFVISEGNLFVARYNSLSALDINTGSVLWNLEWQSSPSFPAVKNNRIYVSERFKIVCIDADRGEMLWEHIVNLLEFHSSPIVIDNFVIVGSGEPIDNIEWNPENIEALERARKVAHRVLCLHAETGEIVWEFYANDIVDSSPGYVDGRVCITISKYIYCLDVQTGGIIWEKKTEWTNFSSLSLGGDKIFVGTSNGMMCLELETGDTVWKFDCGEKIFRTPAVAYDKVFVGTPGGVFYCVDARNGELAWKRETGGAIYSEAVVADKKVAFGTGDGILYIVDVKSGKMCESLHLDNSPITTFALSGGNLFVGQENGRIYCFEGSHSEKSTSIVTGVVIVLLISWLLVAWIWHQRKHRS